MKCRECRTRARNVVTNLPLSHTDTAPERIRYARAYDIPDTEITGNLTTTNGGITHGVQIMDIPATRHGNTLVVHQCPRCGNEHTHGLRTGHKVAPCGARYFINEQRPAVCATCVHNPGRGRVCTVADRHATAAVHDCPHHQRRPGAHLVEQLRRLAIEALRDGQPDSYAILMRASHELTEIDR